MRTLARNALNSFDRVGYVGFPHKLKLKSYDFYIIFRHFLMMKYFLTHLDRNSSSDRATNAGVPQDSSFGPTVSLSRISDLFENVPLMILVSSQNVTKHLACGNKL